jgi:hypothetical protein
MAGATSSFVGSLPLPPLPPFLLPEPHPSEPLLGNPLAGAVLPQEQQDRLVGAAAAAAVAAAAAAAAPAAARPQAAGGQAPGAAAAAAGPATSSRSSAGMQPRAVVMRDLPHTQHAVGSSKAGSHSQHKGWLGGMLSAFGLGGREEGHSAAAREATLPAPVAPPPPPPAPQPPAPAAPAAPAPALAAAAAAPPAGFSRAAELSGVWQKDTGRSDADGYERGLDLWQLSPLHKAGARLIEGLRITHAAGKLTIYFLTILPESMFKVGSTCCCVVSMRCCVASTCCCVVSACCCVVSARCCVVSACCCVVSARCCVVSACCCVVSARCWQLPPWPRWHPLLPP